MTGMHLPKPLPAADWMDKGACLPPPGASQARRRYLTAVMFATTNRGQDGDLPHPKAVELCAACPVSGECHAYAMKHRIKDGTWGGFTGAQRERLRLGKRIKPPSPVKVGKPPAVRYVNCSSCSCLKRSDVSCGCGEGS